MKKKQDLTITPALIGKYAAFLREQERSAATIEKYVHDLTALSTFLAGRPISKGLLLEWKEDLIGQYAPASVNNKLAAINGFLSFCGRNDLRLRKLKIQKALFLSEDKELTKAEYVRLVKAAQRNENERLSLVIQTICATGIRVSELRFITAEAVQTGRAEVSNKGKRRAVFLPDKLRKLLKSYLQKQKITAGAVFVSRNGKPLNRSNIWRDMKKLCESAGSRPRYSLTTCATCSPAPTTRWKRICPGWRTSWATPMSPPPAFTPPRAEPSTPGRLDGWAWLSHNFRSVVAECLIHKNYIESA